MKRYLIFQEMELSGPKLKKFRISLEIQYNFLRQNFFIRIIRIIRITRMNDMFF